MFVYSFNLLLLYEIENLIFIFRFALLNKVCIFNMCLILQNILDTILLCLVFKKAPAYKSLLFQVLFFTELNVLNHQIFLSDRN